LGRGTPKYFKEAARWHHPAAEQGDEGASYIIASMYENGDGVGQDLQMAWYWYSQAAVQGDRTAGLKAQEVLKKLRPD
jgi:uncharacterized protein